MIFFVFILALLLGFFIGVLTIAFLAMRDDKEHLLYKCQNCDMKIYTLDKKYVWDHHCGDNSSNETKLRKL